MSEIWAKIKDFPRYEVSTLGRARGPRGLLKFDSNGRYARISLSGNGIDTRRYIHDLVLETFVGPKPSGKEVNHKNGIKTDNCVENLEYVTHLENMHHRLRHGLGNGLAAEHVRLIRNARGHPTVIPILAKRFQLTRDTIRRIAFLRHYRSVA